MRAKDCLEKMSEKTMIHFDLVNRIVNDLYKIRHDKEATVNYYDQILIADIRDDEHKDWEQLHQEYGALEREPQYDKHKDEIGKEAASSVRYELLNVVQYDKSFGYIVVLLKKEKILPEKNSEVEDALRQELIEELDTAQKKISKLEEQLTCENIEILKQNSNRLDISINRGSMSIVSVVLYEILKKLDVLKDKGIYNTNVANFISYITGYSDKTIRQRLSNIYDFADGQKEEIDRANKLLEEVGIEITIKKE